MTVRLRTYEPHGVGDDRDPLEKQQDAIRTACEEMCAFLQEKNRSYQGSAFRDISYCGRAIRAEDTVDTRIVDKIRRLQSNDPSFDGEDAEKDLLGYLLIKQALKILRQP